MSSYYELKPCQGLQCRDRYQDFPSSTDDCWIYCKFAGSHIQRVTHDHWSDLAGAIMTSSKTVSRCREKPVHWISNKDYRGVVLKGRFSSSSQQSQLFSKFSTVLTSVLINILILKSVWWSKWKIFHPYSFTIQCHEGMADRVMWWQEIRRRWANPFAVAIFLSLPERFVGYRSSPWWRLTGNLF